MSVLVLLGVSLCDRDISALPFTTLPRKVSQEPGRQGTSSTKAPALRSVLWPLRTPRGGCRTVTENSWVRGLALEVGRSLGLGPRCFWAFGCNSSDSGSIGNRKLSDNLTASKTRMMILTRSKRGQHKTDVFTAFETSLPFANDVVSVCYCFTAVLPVRSHVARLLKRCGALLARRLSGTHTHTWGYGLGRRRLIQKWRPTGSESLSVKVVCMLCNNYIS